MFSSIPKAYIITKSSCSSAKQKRRSPLAHWSPMLYLPITEFTVTAPTPAFQSPSIDVTYQVSVEMLLIVEAPCELILIAVICA
ncbi:unnamed protein product [Dracunculus medinensis]|uniref:Ovule protein n=1 Tax=Dracunculus medinensis TaxID=318479 RepID=A0A0N4U3T9_DRAME|nr:unnamed protein product [Dracunculus medinensis]